MTKAQKYLDKNCPKAKRSEIKSINLSNKDLKGHLDLSDFTSLIILDCSHNSLTSIELRNCVKLEQLDCSDNRLRQLELRGLNSLQEVKCDDNYLPQPRVEELIQKCHKWQEAYEDLVKKVEAVKRITGIKRISDIAELQELEDMLEGQSVREALQNGKMNESRVNHLRQENSSLRKRVTELIVEKESLIENQQFTESSLPRRLEQKRSFVRNPILSRMEETIIDDYLNLDSENEVSLSNAESSQQVQQQAQILVLPKGKNY
ncbi:leucine-rich repeat domain-containing protein [endosymbiont GvMRE of Glomus versiforme]|uniref:leucine-rich repeat domain-containing protein n=1 Tax=endosymbiont GvMRE of Glomus versiforme TaxID=2039283 RepID=UPI000EBC4895|nr:leucine-rich repeat domain-containing protein [endosymbiont GvMRE of Glomus versiforme]RHZ36755.1 hypothetical protein GvMRE_I2g71 [endosymbiont GvMRE of Glomus versiforme]